MRRGEEYAGLFASKKALKFIMKHLDIFRRGEREELSRKNGAGLIRCVSLDIHSSANLGRNERESLRDLKFRTERRPIPVRVCRGVMYRWAVIG